MEATMLLDTYLKQLRLPTFLQNYRKFAEDAAQDNLGYDRFLLALAEQEIAQREQNRRVRRIKAARFPVLKELADFDFSAIPGLNKQKVLDRARRGPVEGLVRDDERPAGVRQEAIGVAGVDARARAVPDHLERGVAEGDPAVEGEGPVADTEGRPALPGLPGEPGGVGHAHPVPGAPAGHVREALPGDVRRYLDRQRPPHADAGAHVPSRR